MLFCQFRNGGANGGACLTQIRFRRSVGNADKPVSHETGPGHNCHAGRGEAEALERAHAYEAAGADMILIHSKEKTPDEIESFIRGWTGSVPIVIVPTAYPQMTEARAKSLKKVGMLIYGNHAIRAAVTGMQKVFARIIADGGIETVNDEIVPVSEIFRLQDMDMVKQIETQFLR